MVTRKPVPGQRSPLRLSSASLDTKPADTASRTEDNPWAEPTTRPQIPIKAPHVSALGKDGKYREPSDDEWDESDLEWDANTDVDEEEQRDTQEGARITHDTSQVPSRSVIDGEPSTAPSIPYNPALRNMDLSQEPGALHASHTGQSQHSILSASSAYSQTSTSPQSNNPFIRPQNTGEALFGAEPPTAVWSDEPSGPSPVHTVPKNLNARPPHQDALYELSGLSIGDKAWAPEPSNPPPQLPTALPPPVPISSQDRPQISSPQQSRSPTQPPLSHTRSDSSNAPIALPLIDVEPSSANNDWSDQQAVPSLPAAAPPLPMSPMSREVTPPAQPPRPLASPPTSPISRTGADSKQRQRKEHYQIKHVRWFDAACGRTRVSPILTQNLNGPCPLLALVNALVLSTPIDVTTGLVETLRTREQVSLGLLLDAVFDELVTRGQENSVDPLPDVGELYAFLLTLHTGMNVNPQFVQPQDQSTSSLSRPGTFESTREMKLYSTFGLPLVHGWIPEGESHAYSAFDRSAKTYEDAQNIQFHEEELEHKIGSTGLNQQEQDLFEDLITIKDFLMSWPTQLTDHGLDVISANIAPGSFAILFRNDHFSTIYKEPRSLQLLTLVTDAGYSSHDEIVWESLVDVNGMGSEYFSGDFRPIGNNNAGSSSAAPSAGPRNSSLGQQKFQSMLDVDQGWTTVPNKRNTRGKQASTEQESGYIPSGNGSTGAGPIPPSSAISIPPSDGNVRSAEQEDADLALALQLQEEEDDRHRQATTQRRREDQLSQQFLERDASAPNAPPRRPSPTATNRPMIPPRRNQDDAPPPTYEQASQAMPFVPGRGHPLSPGAPVGSGGGGGSGRPGAGGQGPRRQSAYASSAAQQGNYGRRVQNGVLIDQIPQGSGLGRRRSGPGGQVGGQEDREKCVVM